MRSDRNNLLLQYSMALQGLGLGVVFVLISLLSLNFGTLYVTLLFVPLAAVYFWPSGAGYGPSLWSIGLIGLFQDFATSGPLGLWTLTYVTLFIIINPTLRPGRAQFRGHWFWFACLVLAAIGITSVLGAISLGQWPDAIRLFADGLCAILLFPAIYWLRLFFEETAGVDSQRRRL